MDEEERRFAHWLNLTMERRGLSQADLAREVGVADAQVSRWRRGRVIPTVRSLQRIADTLGVPRATLDSLAGYPTGEWPGDAPEEGGDPALQAELQVYQAWYRQLLEQQVPRGLWRVYAESCAALAQALSASWQAGLGEARHDDLDAGDAGDDSVDATGIEGTAARQAGPGVGFRPARPERDADR
jgi:transcriptional regulator with XRE-family HTH domain